MKPPTINQLNGRLAANATIRFYYDQSSDEARWSRGWRQRSWNYVYPGGRSSQVTPLGNWIYGAAMDYYHRIAGVSRGYDYQRDNKQSNFDIEGLVGRPLQFQIRVQRDMGGVVMSVETNFKPITGDEWGKRFDVRSNLTFEEFDPKEYFLTRILPKYLFAPGIFRNIQIWLHCTKSEALEKYRLMSKREPFEVDVWKAWRRLFKRRLNIQVCDEFPDKHLPAIFRTYQYQKNRKKLFKHPSVLDMVEAYSMDHDDDGHEIEFVNDYFNDNYPNNAIFI